MDQFVSHKIDLMLEQKEKKHNIEKPRTDEFAYFLRRNSVIDDSVEMLMESILTDDSNG